MSNDDNPAKVSSIPTLSATSWPLGFNRLRKWGGRASVDSSVTFRSRSPFELTPLNLPAARSREGIESAHAYNREA